MAVRMQWNLPELLSLLTDSGTSAEIERITHAVDQATDSDSRVDFASTGERYRGAVIAGYEHGATAEHTRRALLRGLDGAA